MPALIETQIPLNGNGHKKETSFQPFDYTFEEAGQPIRQKLDHEEVLREKLSDPSYHADLMMNSEDPHFLDLITAK